MRVAFDVQPTVGSATGIGEYARELARALGEIPEIELVPLSAPRIDPWRFDRRVFWDQLLLPLAAARRYLAIARRYGPNAGSVRILARRIAAQARP